MRENTDRSEAKLCRSRSRYLRLFAKIVLAERAYASHTEYPHIGRRVRRFGPIARSVGVYAGEGSCFQGTRVNLLFLHAHPAVFGSDDSKRQLLTMTDGADMLVALLNEDDICSAIAGGAYCLAAGGSVLYQPEGVHAWFAAMPDRLAALLTHSTPSATADRIVTTLGRDR